MAQIMRIFLLPGAIQELSWKMFFDSQFDAANGNSGMRQLLGIMAKCGHFYFGIFPSFQIADAA